MPRLSMYRPNRTADYQFLDRTIKEMYTIGGADFYIHKYLGPIVDTTGTGNADATLPVYDTTNPLFIEDLLLLENRDRAYDPNVYIMRGVYNTQDIDFDLTQFGLFLNNDTIFITFHYNNMIDMYGRKLMNGDVIEVPNLKDYYPLDSAIARAIPKYYVIQDASYASEGFSQTWLPHLWRVKATPMVNAQEYNDITNKPFEPENIWDNGNFYPAGTIVNAGDVYYRAKQNVPADIDITNTAYWEVKTPNTIAEVISTRNKDLEINDAILIQADAEVPLSGYDNGKFYILATADGQPAGAGLTADGSTTVDGSQGGEGTTPKSFGYAMGYLTGDDKAPNGLPVTPGVSFPTNPAAGDYALRLDYLPNRLFRYNGAMWVKISDSVRTDLNNGPDNLTLRSSFVNNSAVVPTTDRGPIPSRQSLSEILKPKADNGG
ncbi:hypothetical protein UFOVP1146_12 [uncultured Caudovirales phage]|uniref:Uncharacterized protein n=1 Tax=uncultured Caudovirales phage TaxID=2100421 RepID=A0A6J5PDN4_9CAUD|nr:hypothetical protein UFOVP812_345 [uncultured Caudovirales phage]CAB4165684.1 hypothetical protein UFOVP818_220 [uncultured Caudovirales phage]CAB4186632.1 hypothetical protein UFOVP1146_12 [uncultured Caudovirales phage]CAB4221046.1 hypothetical protein UFOVP1638_133 [uncultured Caudovirales phage]